MSGQGSRNPAPIDPRWIRHDAHLWIQPNIERWMKPGVDPADVIPALARERAQKEAARERAQAAEDAAFYIAIEHERRWLAAMREELNEIKAELARRRRLAEVKYSPSQPRVPRGDSRGGQWTDGSTGGSIARPMGSVVVGDPSGSSELTPSDPRVDGVQLAGEPIDLLEQERRGGHSISEHAGKTYDYLKSRARDEGRRTLERGDYFDGFGVGSFTSVQSANRLVNSTISENQDKVDQAIRNGEPAVTISKRFPSPTGYEAYLARAHSEPYIRNTFGVRVIILRDPESARGWRVQSAYPIR